MEAIATVTTTDGIQEAERRGHLRRQMIRTRTARLGVRFLKARVRVIVQSSLTPHEAAKRLKAELPLAEASVQFRGASMDELVAIHDQGANYGWPKLSTREFVSVRIKTHGGIEFQF
jgi:hypothetical protein